MNTDNQWSKQEACFAHATQVWLSVNHNISVTSGKWIQCSKRTAQASELGSCQSNLSLSWGYERLQKSKDSLKDCFENVNNIAYYTQKVLGIKDWYMEPKHIVQQAYNIYWKKRCYKSIEYYIIIDLCWGRHGVLLNSKHYIDRRGAEVNMIKFTVQ